MPGIWRVGPAVVPLLASYAAQTSLLVSPAVYQHTRRDPLAGPAAAPVTVPVRHRPPAWMPLVALFAGLAVPLLYLGSMGSAALPGCGPAGASVSALRQLAAAPASRAAA